MSELEQFKATYFTECSELLAETEEHLALLEQGTRDVDLLHAVFRAVHSIKGGAGAFGFDDLVAFTHSFETLLDLLREQKVEATPNVIGLCLRAIDIVSDLVAAARDGAPLDATFGAEVKAKIEHVSGGGSGATIMESFEDLEFTPVRVELPDDEPDDVAPAHPTSPEAGSTKRWLIRFRPHRALFERANEPVLILRELQSLGAAKITADVSGVLPLADFDAARPVIGWTVTLETAARRDEIEAVFEFVEGDCDLTIEEAAAEAPSLVSSATGTSLADLLREMTGASEGEAEAVPDAPQPSFAELAAELAPQKAPRLEQTNPDAAPKVATAAREPAPKEAQVASIRVDLDKIDRVVDMVGELVITQAMLTQQTDDLLRERYPDIVRGLEVLAQHTRSLQDSVMSIRAQPVKSVFARMPRLVRELATQLNKRVRLEMQGEMTEIDKTVIEQLSDPLTHMIRNSLDHGIETPDRRLAVGKAEEGVIRLSAEQAGGRIIIQIADDGAGINRERVLQKAVEKGIVAEEASLSEEEIDELIFAPGFSTAEIVTSVSGRGVGMDVVRQNIQKLGGRVTVRNTPGRGAAMTLTLPLTLAVLDIMLVRVGSTPFVVPLASIIESMKMEGTAIGQLPSGGRVLRARGDYVQLIDLAELFDLAHVEPEDGGETGFIILCESDGSHRIAVIVDQILGQQQVVIKSIEQNFERLDGIAGATILGDGCVALILDVAGLKRVAARRFISKAAA